ncbi:MAG: recombinase [Neisseria sp.]|uniref:site-specific recombinase n=1 Tax=Neisseria sp. TaxID=192066 RepID=UPI0026DC0A10|nr:recombinase [Neisseria sp.]MDO4640711.1 recombinase [Neisseria sp.]
MYQTILPKKDLTEWLNRLGKLENTGSTLASITHWLRKGGSKDAAPRMALLLQTLSEHPETAAQIGTQLHRWLNDAHIYPALVTLGIFSRRGFSRELGKRIYDRFSPPPHNERSLKHMFQKLFYRSNDTEWLQTIPPRQWLRLYEILAANTPESIRQSTHRNFQHANLYALEMLSIWIAAEELDSDLIRLDPKLLEVDSPFVALKREVAELIEHYQQGKEGAFDDGHLQVMLAQSQSQIERLRKKGVCAGAGSSIAVSHLLERLDQSLERLTVLLAIQTATDKPALQRYLITLLQAMASAAAEQKSASMLWRRSVKMLAKSISQNTSNRGEHYITSTKAEYFSMLRAAAGGGVVIALMALLKLKLGMMGLSKLQYAILSSLDYGLGFVFIHMIHCTVATKQPAMTASSIAEQVERNESGKAVDQKLAKLSIDVIRSQGAAVFGNVSVAVLVSVLVTALYYFQTGMPILDEATVHKQFKSVLPLSQPSLIYAGIAGIWLFCSGIISGFFDNRADYLNLNLRLKQHPLLVKILPARIRDALAEYLHRNYGAIMGNFIFGVMLGSTSYIGYLLDLPLDIRHVAFSSANIAYAAATDLTNPLLFGFYLFCVLLIGIVNLWVSFTLTLWVALRSRDTRIGSFRKLFNSMIAQIRANPLSLLFPVQAAGQLIKEARQPTAQTKEKEDK